MKKKDHSKPDHGKHPKKGKEDVALEDTAAKGGVQKGLKQREGVLSPARTMACDIILKGMENSLMRGMDKKAMGSTEAVQDRLIEMLYEGFMECKEPSSSRELSRHSTCLNEYCLMVLAVSSAGGDDAMPVCRNLSSPIGCC